MAALHRRMYPLALVAGILPGLLPSMLSAAAGDARLALEQRVEEAKLEAITLLDRMARQELALHHPVTGRVQFYVDQQVAGIALDEIRILINQQERARHRYSRAEARALRGEGLHAVAILDLPPGEHLVVAEFSGRRLGGNGGPVAGEITGAFTKAGSAVDIVLPVAEREQGARIEVTLAGAHGDDPDHDHALRQARFFHDQGRYFSALTALPGASGDPTALSVARLWLLADAALAYGMMGHARAALDELGRRRADPARHAAAMLALADLAYRRADFAQALATVRQGTPGTAQRELLGRILIGMNQHDAAAAQLAPLAADDVYAAFNLAVALIRAGHERQGWQWLDLIGAVGPQNDRDVRARALREQANLLLGFHYLRQRNGEAAKAPFTRIRLEGPYSNRALLGLGWAELTRPGADADPAALHRALRPWRELASRDPMDPAVQEGLLALAHAFSQLGDHEQTLKAYQQAIEVFETGRARIAAGIRSVNDALMLQTILRRDAGIESGDRWRLLDLPDLPETWWLHPLLAEHRVQEQIKNFRDLRLIIQRLDEWERRGGERLQVSPKRPGPMPALHVPAAPAQPLRLRFAERLQPRAAANPQPVAWRSLSLRTTQVATPPPDAASHAQRALSSDLEYLVAFRLRVESLADRQSGAIRELTAGELEAQRAVLDRYLTLARFAVARMFDQQLRGFDRSGEP